MKYSKSQLNAISRSITRRNQEAARNWLMKHCGFSFDEYAEKYGYKGSPCMLVNSISWKQKRTMEKVLGLIAEKYGERFTLPEGIYDGVYVWEEEE